MTTPFSLVEISELAINKRIPEVKKVVPTIIVSILDAIFNFNFAFPFPLYNLLYINTLSGVKKSYILIIYFY